MVRYDNRTLRSCTAATLLGLALLTGVRAAGAQALGFAGDEQCVNVGRRAVSYSPRVAVFPDGGFAVVWSSTRRIPSPVVLHARFFGPDDAPLTGEFLLLPPALGKLGYQSADALLADEAGNLLLVWSEGSLGPGSIPIAVFAQRLSHTGAPLGPRIRVSAPSPHSIVGAWAAFAPGGGFVVTWAAEAPLRVHHP